MKFRQTGSVRQRRWPVVLFLSALILIGVLGVFGLVQISENALPEHFGIVVLTEPIVIITGDRQSQKLTLFRLPHDTVFSVIHGLGDYPLAGVMKLDDLESREGKLLTGTVSESFAFPVHYYAVPGSGKTSDAVPTSLEQVRQLFSLANALQLGQTETRTNLTLRERIGLARILRSRRYFFDYAEIADRTGLETMVHTDGSSVMQFDTESFDRAYSELLEIVPVRKEGYKVTVINSTETPGLAGRFERYLEHAGFLIENVRSDATSRTACEWNGTAMTIPSASSRYLTEYLDCHYTPENMTTGTDLTVWVGRDYESLFLPLDSVRSGE